MNCKCESTIRAVSFHLNEKINKLYCDLNALSDCCNAISNPITISSNDNTVTVLKTTVAGVPNYDLSVSIPQQVNLNAGNNILITGSYPNLTISSTATSTGTVSSVNATASGALSFTGGPITNTGTLVLGWNGSNSQYVAGDGSLIAFPTFPIVNNGLLTINTSGIAIGSGTFSANQSTNNTISIAVPGTNLSSNIVGSTVTINSSTGSSTSFVIPTSTAVTSVNANVGNGNSLSFSGGPITSAGTLQLQFQGTSTQYINGAGNLTLFPNIPLQLNAIAGSNMAITGTYPNLTFTSTASGGGGGTVIQVDPGIGMDFTAFSITGEITLGQPSNITLSSTNNVIGTTHTHAFVPGGTTSQYITGAGTLVTFPNIPSQVNLTAGTGINIAGVYPNLTISNTVTNTITRLRGESTGTFVSGDISLMAGTNVTIGQLGNNITISSTNTTYTAGTGISIVGGVISATGGTGTVTSVGLSMPNAFNVANSPITSTGTLTVTGAGTAGQYINGLGNLVTFPTIPTVNNNAITYQGGGIATGGGTFTLNQTSSSTFTINVPGTNLGSSVTGNVVTLISSTGVGTSFTVPGGSSSYTFTNGISESSGVVKLGNPLTENTTIDSAGYTFRLGSTGLTPWVISAQANGIYLGSNTSAGLIIGGSATQLSYSTSIKTDNLTLSDKIFQMPNRSGVPVMMINGLLPDNTGAITIPGGGISSIGLTMPTAFTVTGSPLTANGTIGVTGAGTTAQYIRGDGSLATFPTIPTVNNATLTLATSGIATGSQTFTANQASAATFTVNVPATNLGSSVVGSNVTITSSTGTSTTFAIPGGSGGTVTSVTVGIGGPYNAALSSSGNPITGGGTITITPNLFTSTTAGVVPASGGGTTNFLRADGTWATVSSGSVTASNGLTAVSGDVRLGGLINTNTTVNVGTNSLSFYSGTAQVQLNNSNLNLTSTNGINVQSVLSNVYTNIRTTDLTANRILQMPNADGRVVITVNGVAPDIAGNVVVSGGGGGLTSVGIISGGSYNQAIEVTGSPLTANGSITITPKLFTSSTPGIVPPSGGNINHFLRSDGSWVAPSGGGGGITSIGLTMPAAFTVTGSPLTANGTLAVTANGTASQYIRGDGVLATMPTGSAYTSDNGITLTGTNFQLGGSLLQNTLIDTQGYTFGGEKDANNYFALYSDIFTTKTDQQVNLISNAITLNAAGGISLISGTYINVRAGGSFGSALSTSNLTAIRINSMPNAGGTLALSVNNIAANAAGNITVPIPAQLNAIAGTNMSITGTYPNLTFNASGGGGGGITALGMYILGGTALAVSPATITANGSFDFEWTGTTAQYVRGDGSLATFPNIPAQVNLIAGSNVTITGTYPNLTINSTGGGGGSTTASNGLTLVGSDVRLGGTVTGITDVNASGQMLSFYTSGAEVVLNDNSLRLGSTAGVCIYGGTSGYIGASKRVFFKTDNVTALRTLQLPDNDGIPILTINSAGPTSNGNLNLSIPAQFNPIAGTNVTITGTYPNITFNASPGGGGSVVSVSAGNGMSFTTITNTGSVTLGTPSAITLASSNSVSTGTHSHAFTPGGTTSQYISGAGTLITFPTIPSQFNPIAGTNMSITGTYPNLTFNATNTVMTASNGLNVVGTDIRLGGTVTSTATIYLNTAQNLEVHGSGSRLILENEIIRTYAYNGLRLRTGNAGWSTNVDAILNTNLLSANRNYEFPNASGTLALQTDIPAQANLIAGTNVTITGTYPNLTINAAPGGGGSVVSVGAGNGMNFTTITGTGNVVLGTPSAITLSSTNSVTTNSHTHTFTPGGTTAQYITGAGTLVTFPTIPAQVNVIGGTRTSVTGTYPNLTVNNTTVYTTSPGLLSSVSGNTVTHELNINFTGGLVVTTTGMQLNVDASGLGGSYTGSTSIILSGTSFERAALTGDVTAALNSNATTIANNAVTTVKIANSNVTLAKLENIPSRTILGNVTASTAAVTALTKTNVHTLTGTTAWSISTLTFSASSGTVTNIGLPNASFKWHCVGYAGTADKLYSVYTIYGSIRVTGCTPGNQQISLGGTHPDGVTSFDQAHIIVTGRNDGEITQQPFRFKPFYTGSGGSFFWWTFENNFDSYELDFIISYRRTNA